jgi:hypothetical protein
VAKRKSAADSSQPHGRVTQEFIDQGKKNLAKGRAKKAAQREEYLANNEPERAGVRWQKLLDGTLKVRDLDDEEVNRMQVRGADGGFTGKRQPLPSHLAQEFHREIINRAQVEMRKNLGDIVAAVAEIALNPEAKDSDRIKAGNLIMDRVLGKAVETVRVEGASKFDEMLSAVVDVDRDVADLSVADLGEDGPRS